MSCWDIEEGKRGEKEEGRKGGMDEREKGRG